MMWIFIAVVALFTPILSSHDEGKESEVLSRRRNSSKHFHNVRPSNMELELLFNHQEDAVVNFHGEYCSILINDESYGRSSWMDISGPKNVLKLNSGGFKHVGLKFDFPFYNKEFDGMNVHNEGMIKLCTDCNGIIDLVSDKIYPLKALYNRDSNTTKNIKAHQFRDRIVVQWENMTLFHHSEEGSFSFQLSLLYDGTIIFVYKNIPMDLSTLGYFEIGFKSIRFEKTSMPAKNGHQVELTTKAEETFELDPIRDVKNWTTLFYTPDVDCNKSLNCHDCTSINLLFKYPQCYWCTETNECVNRCSGFLPSHKASGCQVTREAQCNQTDAPRPTRAGIPIIGEPIARTSTTPKVTTLKPHTTTAPSTTNEISSPMPKCKMADDTTGNNINLILTTDHQTIIVLMVLIVGLGIFFLARKKWETISDLAHRLGRYLRHIRSIEEQSYALQDIPLVETHAAQNDDVPE